jgi:hypothetical protein
MKAQSIEIIFDRDHGKENEGWYARAKGTDGQERDLPFDARRSAGNATVVRKARAAVRDDGYAIPRNCDISVNR